MKAKGTNKMRFAQAGLAIAAAGAIALSGLPGGSFAGAAVSQVSAAENAQFSDDALLAYAGDGATDAGSNTAKDDPVTIIVQLDPQGRQGYSLMGLLSGTNQQKRHEYFKNKLRAELAEDTQPSGKYQLQSSSSGDVIEELYDYYTAFDGFAIKAPAWALKNIVAEEGVKTAFIAREFKVETPAVTSSDGAGANLSSLDMTGADAVAQKGDGQVIAIVDSGLDVTHEAFGGDLDDATLAWDEATAYEKRRQCVQGGKDALYVSEKIPFAYDYGDGDTNVVPSLGSLDHGTHVAGIAAANAGEITGTAPNAQIAIMKVANDFVGSIAEASLLAALDDVASLEPDVLNMSIGSDGGFSAAAASTYGDIFKKLEQTGCTLCISAGNSYTSAYGNSSGQNLSRATDPDQGIVSSPASLTETLAVASVGNATATPYFTMADGTQIRYIEAERSEGIGGKKFANVKDGTYEYVDAGYGTKAEVEALRAAHEGTFKKTIVLAEDTDVREGDYTVMTGNRVSNISELNPGGIVLYNSGKGAREAKAIGGNSTVAVACITHDDGQKLLAAEDKHIVVKQGQMLPAEDTYSMDAFSSWGSTPEMGLKPEIAAPGGNIYSSVLNGKYGTKSGTSMASPQVAGISALVREYVEADAKFSAMSDAEKQGVVAQLLMSTARPLANESADDSYYSPRQQGAGFVNVPAAVSTPVFLSVDGAANPYRPKAELGESAQGTWEFAVTLHNMSDAPQAYTLDAAALSERIEDGRFQQVSDNYAGKGIDVAFGGAAYDAQAGTVRVDAHAEATLTVRITCGDAFKAAVAQAENGTFVDGFVMLHAATEGGVDLSVPYLGFYGQWGKAPVFDAQAGSGSKAQMFASCLTNANTGDTLGVNPLTRDAESLDYGNATVSVAGGSTAPNMLYPKTGLLRGVENLRYEYCTAAGEVVRSYSYDYVSKSDKNAKYPEEHLDVEPVFAGTDDSGAALEDGAYKLRIVAKTAGGASVEQEQVTEFTLDTKAPAIDAFEANDERVTVVASDENRLAGIDFHDPASGAYFHRVAVDAKTPVQAVDGRNVYTFDVALEDLQAAWKEAGLEGDMAADAFVCAWDYGLNETRSDVDLSAAHFTIEDGVLTAYTGTNTRVQVPEGVTAIASGAFENSKIRSIALPASLETIGARAFYGAEQLQQVSFAADGALAAIEDSAFAASGVLDVVLPATLTKLGTGVFAESALRSAVVPASITDLPARTFADSKLQKVVLPSGLETIGKLAFSGCKGMRELYVDAAAQNPYELPASVTKIGDAAFEKCGLAELILNDGLVEICASAFAGSSISELVVPDSVTKLDAGALCDMLKLRKVTLGAGVKAAQVAGVLNGCSALTSVEVSATSQTLSSVDGVLFSDGGKTLLLYPQGRTSDYVVPAGVTSIGKEAFRGAALRHVELPATSIAIGESAFEGSGLQSVDMGAANTIDAHAFANCADLSAVDFRTDLNALTAIGASAFSPGTPLAAVVLPDSVTSIATGAFASNRALETVHLGAGFSAAYSSVFAGCENVSKLSVSGKNAVYASYGGVLYSKQSDGLHLAVSPSGNTFETYTVRKGTTVIDQRAFKNNAKLKSVVLPEGLVSIGAGAFSGCPQLSSVVFPGSLQTVSGFYGNAIEVADFGTQIRAIKSSAFNGHNPAHLVVRGGVKGTYASSIESSDDPQPIKTAYFGPGMVKADFSASSIVPPSVVIVSADMDELKFCKPSGSLVYDPADVVVYAPEGSGGWDAAAAALERIGADPAAQLKALNALSVKASGKAAAVGATTSIAAQATGGIGEYEFRFVQVDAKGNEVVLQDWSAASSAKWKVAANVQVRAEVRDATYYSAACEATPGVLKPSQESQSGKTQTKASDKKAKAVVINAKKVTKKVVRAALKKANNPKATIVTLGKKVKRIAKGVFKGTKIKTVVLKTKKLKKSMVKGCFKGSKVKTVKVAVGSKKANKKALKKYKKFLAKKAVVGKKGVKLRA